MEQQQKHKDIWVYAEHKNGKLVPASEQLLGEGARLVRDMPQGSRLCAVITGKPAIIKNVAQECFQCGADVAYTISDEHLKVYTTDGYTKAMATVIDRFTPDILLFGATHEGRDLAPRIAARLGIGLTADCTRLDIKASDYLEYAREETLLDTSGLELDDVLLKQTKPSFGGKLMATMVCPDARPQMATVRPGVMDAPERNADASGEIIPVEVNIKDEDIRVSVKSVTPDPEAKISLTEADIIVAGGRGLGDEEGFQLLHRLADKIGGVVATSGAPVDAGWADESLMIGQTGTIVRPKLYIACGISGSIQHIAGIENSDTIIAINTDPAVPIFEVADYCIVGDLYQVVPELIEHWDEFATKL